MNIIFWQVFNHVCKFNFELSAVHWSFHARVRTVDTYTNYAVNTTQFLCLLKQRVSTHVDCHTSNTNDGSRQPGKEVATSLMYNNRQRHVFQSPVTGIYIMTSPNA